MFNYLVHSIIILTTVEWFFLQGSYFVQLLHSLSTSILFVQLLHNHKYFILSTFYIVCLPSIDFCSPYIYCSIIHFFSHKILCTFIPWLLNFNFLPCSRLYCVHKNQRMYWPPCYWSQQRSTRVVNRRHGEWYHMYPCLVA